MPNREELYTALRNADKAGDVEGARKLASYIQSLPPDAAAPAPAAAPGSTGGAGKFLAESTAGFGAGAGTSIGKMALGAQRLYGKLLAAVDDVMPGKPAPTLSNLVSGTKPTSSLSRIANWLTDDADAGKARVAAVINASRGAPFRSALTGSPPLCCYSLTPPSRIPLVKYFCA